jgi:hypothetical protein
VKTSNLTTLKLYLKKRGMEIEARCSDSERRTVVFFMKNVMNLEDLDQNGTIYFPRLAVT